MPASVRKSKLRGIAPLVALCLLGLAFCSGAQAAGGTALAWGYNGSGQIGNGTIGEAGCYCVETPTPVTGLAGVTQIAGGYEHGLALLDNGTVMSWGYNYHGQLGDGTTTDRRTAGPVSGLSGVVAVSAANESSLALLANGAVVAWGENYRGTLGNGDETGPEICNGSSCSKTPLQVPGISNAVAISAGDGFDLALLADGTVMAWGGDESGTLGDGTGITGGCQCDAVPRPVPGMSGAVAISADEDMAAALLLDGTARNWGYNKNGELGTGVASTNAPCFCLGPVSPAGLSGVRAIVAGSGHGIALLAGGGGETKAWGFNREGQVGNGTFSTTGCECVPTPVSVPGLSATAIAAGSIHSMALLANGTGVSWGDGSDGQLGNGSTEDRNQPAPMSLTGASELAATDYGGYAIVGPAQTLAVALAGAGTGKVAGSGLLCPPSCTGRYPQAQVGIFRAQPDPGVGFAGFSAPCTGTGVCQATMSTDQTVTATFGPPKGTAITKATIKSPKKRATFSFSAPGAITGYECKLVKPKPKKHKGKAHKRANSSKKRKPAKFSACTGPKAYKNLKPGKYTFKVRALDILGADANPATRAFKIKRPKPKKRKS